MFLTPLSSCCVDAMHPKLVNSGFANPIEHYVSFSIVMSTSGKAVMWWYLLMLSFIALCNAVTACSLWHIDTCVKFIMWYVSLHKVWLNTAFWHYGQTLAVISLQGMNIVYCVFHEIICSYWSYIYLSSWRCNRSFLGEYNLKAKRNFTMVLSHSSWKYQKIYTWSKMYWKDKYVNIINTKNDNHLTSDNKW